MYQEVGLSGQVSVGVTPLSWRAAAWSYTGCELYNSQDGHDAPWSWAV